MKIGAQVCKAVLDTGATRSIVARRLLKQAKIRKTKTVAKKVGDGRTIHSLRGVDVTVSLGHELSTAKCSTPIPLTLSLAQIFCAVTPR